MKKVLKDLKKLKDVYYDTEEIEVGKELKVKMRMLTSEEETETHAYSMKYEEGLAYLYSVKRETLCRCIIGLNGEEIPEFIEDTDEKGLPEKIQKHVWLRKNVVKGWNQMLVDSVWSGYAKLVERVEEKMNLDIKTEENE